jgi:hypothetical protein
MFCVNYGVTKCYTLRLVDMRKVRDINKCWCVREGTTFGAYPRQTAVTLLNLKLEEQQVNESPNSDCRVTMYV